jgi:uncharacterized membrane protein YhaH (DUF805 family)
MEQKPMEPMDILREALEPLSKTTRLVFLAIATVMIGAAAFYFVLGTVKGDSTTPLILLVVPLYVLGAYLAVLAADTTVRATCNRVRRG